MTERSCPLKELPLDILYLVLPYLDAKSFLALCTTCKDFHQPSIRLDSAYWSHAVRSTFRVPNQPVVQADGQRWQKMYRRLLTQSRVYTWGASSMNRLGHSLGSRHASAVPPRLGGWRPHCSWPTLMEKTGGIGIIADMQCGGWSTTLLNSKGQLYTTGVIDTGDYMPQSGQPGPCPLQYPAGFAQPKDAQYCEPTIAIRQFSSGRSHILGLSDSGRIWSWDVATSPAYHVKFLHIKIRESSSDSEVNSSRFGRVRKVVAGWSSSSAYICGTGIVVWSPTRRADDDSELDTMPVMDTLEIPQTNYQRPRGNSRESKENRKVGSEVGEVLNHIMLEHFVLFVTDVGKVFATCLTNDEAIKDIIELRALRNVSSTDIDVQGSFRSFAVFKNGEVIIGSQAYIEDCWGARHRNMEQHGTQGLKKIPALQKKDVISVAFGDYHITALHSNGKITSYGIELQGCGALGLGGNADPEGRTRGIRYMGASQDGHLVPHANTHGRQVWFEPEKKSWITFMTSGGCNPDEAKERMRMFITDPNVQGEVSEWFEQEGRDWDREPVIANTDEDGLGAYFALSVCAAGWHSGAVVLVNEDLARRVRESCIIPDPQAMEDGQAGSQGPLPPVPASLLSSTTTWLSNTGRAFLGLPPLGQNPSNREQDERNDFLNPIHHGASPKKGFLYAWHNKSFPRLKLSDGSEMPGGIDFHEWKYGQPEWNFDVEV